IIASKGSSRLDRRVVVAATPSRWAVTAARTRLTVLRARLRSRAICRIEAAARQRRMISLRVASFMRRPLPVQVVGQDRHTMGVPCQPREGWRQQVTIQHRQLGAAVLPQPVLQVGQTLEYLAQPAAQTIAGTAQAWIPGPDAFTPGLGQRLPRLLQDVLLLGAASGGA